MVGSMGYENLKLHQNNLAPNHNEKLDLINTLGGHLTSQMRALNWLVSERINSKSQKCPHNERHRT